MKIQNPFRLGLFAGLGVLVAIAIGTTIGSLATVLTYVGAALFLALGLDPIITWLETRKVPRWAAILIVLVAFGGAITGLVFAIIPVVVEQVTKAVAAVSKLIDFTSVLVSVILNLASGARYAQPQTDSFL